MNMTLFPSQLSQKNKDFSRELFWVCSSERFAWVPASSPLLSSKQSKKRLFPQELQPEAKFQQNTVVMGRGSLNRRDTVSSLAECVNTGRLCGNKVFVSRDE